MSTALAIRDIQLPAHLQNQTALLNESKQAAGGIKAGGFPSISIKGSKFHVKKDGESKMISDPRDHELPLMKLKVVIVGWNPNVSKTYFEGEYEAGSDKEPDCRSDDGRFPDADIAIPQHTDCTSCKQNMWGSKVSKTSGKDVKACSDNKRLAVIAADALESEALGLQVTPAALKDFKSYADLLNSKSIPVQSVVTELTFDPQAGFPKLQFGFGGFLDAQQFAVIERRMIGEDVAVIKNPRIVSSARATVPIKPVAAEKPAVQADATQRINPADVAAAKAAIAAAAQLDAEADSILQRDKEVAEANAARVAHLEPSLKAAVYAMGIDSVGGQAILAQFPAPSPVAPVVVDPYAHVPEAVRAGIKTAVEASGGPDSVVGKHILSTFNAAQVPDKKTRTKKTVEAPAAAPAPAQAPVAPTPAPLSTAPAANVVSALGSNLNDLLGQAMKVKA
jgi:hypothetical protein